MRTPIRWGPVILLQGANGLSGVGNAIVMITIPWLVLETTDSPAAAGLVAAISSVPGILAAPFAGWAVDRIGRRTISVISDLLSAVSVASFPLVALVADLTLPVIVALALLGAVFDPAGYTGRKSLIPDVATASGVNVDRLNGWHEGIFAIGWTLGPLVGAVLIATVGAVQSFWVPCALAVIAALLVALLRVGDAGQVARAEAEAAGHGEEGFWRPALRGLRIIWHDPILRALTIAVMVLAAIYLPTESVVLPTHFEDIARPDAFGLVIAALAGGSTVGAFGYGWLSARLSRLTLTRIVLVGTMVSIVPLAMLPPLPVMLLAAFVLGLSWGPMNPLLTTIVQRRVPADAQGRVFGIQLSVFYAAPPIAMLLTGLAIESWGVRITYLVLAALMVATSGAVLLMRSIRGVND